MSDQPKQYQWRDLFFAVLGGAVGGALFIWLCAFFAGDEAHWEDKARYSLVATSLVLAAFVAIFTLREKPAKLLNSVRLAVLLTLLFIIPVIAITPSIVGSDASPAWGLLGAIAGYLLRGLPEGEDS